MDALHEFLDDMKLNSHAQGNFLGLLHILIGRRVSKSDGTLISTGLTWRELAALFKDVRWEKECVREMGQDPEQLSPRDRDRFWYAAIAHARVDSPQAAEAGERLAEALRKHGYTISPSPATKNDRSMELPP